jgi:hypothetical protein
VSVRHVNPYRNPGVVPPKPRPARVRRELGPVRFGGPEDVLVIIFFVLVGAVPIHPASLVMGTMSAVELVTVGWLFWALVIHRGRP